MSILNIAFLTYYVIPLTISAILWPKLLASCGGGYKKNFSNRVTYMDVIISLSFSVIPVINIMSSLLGLVEFLSNYKDWGYSINSKLNKPIFKDKE